MTSFGDFQASGDTGSGRHDNGSHVNGNVRGDILSKFEDAKNEMIEHFMQLRKTTKSLSSSFTGNDATNINDNLVK